MSETTSNNNDSNIWGGPLNRDGADIEKTINGQVGFELKGISNEINEFCLSHEEVSERCTIGFFIYFSNTEGDLFKKVGEIKVKKLEMVFDAPSNEHWLSRLANTDGYLELNDTSIEVIGHRIFQFHRPGRNYGKPNTTADKQPTVMLEDATDYGLSTIKGYQESLRIAYLDFGTILHMLMAYSRRIENGSTEDDISEDELKFLFTGAEINHGEMVSPFFQTERYRDWRVSPTDFSGLDTSVTATLKMEGIYRQPGSTTDYISAQVHPFHRAGSSNITLPAVTVLPPCRRFWFTVDQILKDASAQVEINNRTTFLKRQSGVNKLSTMLNKDELEVIFGKDIGIEP